MRNILLFCVVIASVGLLTGMGFFKDKYVSEDGVKIIVYKQGKEMPIDPNTPHFKELQDLCEDFLKSTTTTIRGYITKKDVSEVKQAELAIEIVYSKQREFKIPFFKSMSKGNHLLIYLTNKYINRETGKPSIQIFFWGPSYYPGYLGPYSAPRDITEIVDILKLMEIDID